MPTRFLMSTWISMNGTSPNRFSTRMKKNCVIRNGRYFRVVSAPSTGVSISSRM